MPLKKIKQFSPIYNTCFSARPGATDFETSHFKQIYFPYLIGIDSLEELYKKTVIVHFVGEVKPWNNDRIKFADKWWEYAKVVSPDLKKPFN